MSGGGEKCPDATRPAGRPKGCRTDSLHGLAEGFGREFGRTPVMIATTCWTVISAKSSPGFCQTHARDTLGQRGGGEVEARHSSPPTPPQLAGLKCSLKCLWDKD